MTQLLTPHDVFFKKVFSQRDAAHSFLANYLPPETSSLLDLDGLTIVGGSFVDDELRSHHSDILYGVALRDGSGIGYVYVLFEHKSYSDRHVAFQLLRYMVRIWEQQRERKEELRPVFPIVVYHGEGKWNHPLGFSSLIAGLPEEMRPYVPNYSYHLCDLSQYSDEIIIGTAYLQIALLLLKYIKSGEFWEKLPGVSQLLTELSEMDKQTALAYFEAILRYISGVRKDKSDAEVKKAIRESFPAGGEMMETILERWAEQGFQQGMQQGMQQGIRQERLHSLLSGIELGLELKFGVEGLRVLPEIRKIKDVDVLHAIQEGLKLVNSPDELGRLYQKNAPNETTTGDTPTHSTSSGQAQVHEEAVPYTVKTPLETSIEDEKDE